MKEKIKELIKSSISADFSESLKNRHHTWIGEIEYSISLTEKEEKNSFSVFFTKPSHVWDLKFAGIDRCRIFLTKPDFPIKDDLTPHIKGIFLRKSEELSDICMAMWEHIQNSFDVEKDDKFLFNISRDNHISGMDCKNFMVELKINISF